MRVSGMVGARACLAALLIPVLSVSAFGQAAPTPAQAPVAQTPPKPAGQPPPAPPQTPGSPPPVKTVGPLSPVQTPTTEAPPIQEQRSPGATVQLALDDTVKRALEHNLDVQVERINPRLDDFTIAAARGAWAPTVGGNASYASDASQAEDTLQGAASVTDKRFASNMNVSQFLPWFGTNYSIGWDNARATTDRPISVFNPGLQSALNLQFNQPVLRGFLIDGNRTDLLVSRKNREISDVALRQTIVQTTRQVRIAYWELVYARANLGVAQQSLDLARQTLKDNRTRVEVGTMAPIDIVQAEAEVARNEETAILAAAAIDDAEDQLRQLIFDPNSPDFWNTNLDLTDSPQLPSTTTDVDVEAAVVKALQNRTDLMQLRKSLEASDLTLRFTKNQLLPQVDAFANYGLSAFGGVNRGENQQDPTDDIITSYGDVLNSVFGRDFPTWTLGVRVSYPLGNSAPKAQYARQRLQYDQDRLSLRSQELSVAGEVRGVGRTVNTNRRRVDATRAAKVFSERQLEAEQKKFAVGLSTNFQVIQAQRDLAQARDAELQAIISYVQSLVNFEAVQEAGVSGGGSNGGNGGQNNGNQGTGGTNNQGGNNQGGSGVP